MNDDQLKVQYRLTEPGKGDDVACVKCGAVALDTGLECTECGYDNYGPNWRTRRRRSRDQGEQR